MLDVGFVERAVCLCVGFIRYFARWGCLMSVRFVVLGVGGCSEMRFLFCL